jgi:hypothetical protein
MDFVFEGARLEARREGLKKIKARPKAAALQIDPETSERLFQHPILRIHQNNFALVS